MAAQFTAFVVVGLCSLRCLGVCSELPLDSDNQEDLSTVVSSKHFEEDVVPSLNLKYSPESEDISDMKPVISDPLFEAISWNASVSQQLNRKRDVPENGLSHEVKMQILQLHNIYRSNVTPPAGDMSFMEWDEELARLAQIWSDGCVFSHGFPENDYPTLIGQNLYIGTDPTGYLGLWMWYEEYHNFDIRKKYCIPGKMCGHYLTMAWAPTNKVGCGMAKCNNRYLLTCHYSPPALQGVQIYRIAKPCSQCSSKNGALCLKNLCMTWEQCKQNPFDCQFAQCDLECLNCGQLDKQNCLCECADGWDSPDCSYLCSNKHARCGKSPGFPTKAACSLNNYNVAENFCRLMCEACNPIAGNLSKNNCCSGILCEEGYVLDPHEKCKCQLLCPGPICDSKEEIQFQASVQSGRGYNFRTDFFLALWILIIWSFLKIETKWI